MAPLLWLQLYPVNQPCSRMTVHHSAVAIRLDVLKLLSLNFKNVSLAGKTKHQQPIWKHCSSSFIREMRTLPLEKEDKKLSGFCGVITKYLKSFFQTENLIRSSGWCLCLSAGDNQAQQVARKCASQQSSPLTCVNSSSDLTVLITAFENRGCTYFNCLMSNKAAINSWSRRLWNVLMGR